MALKSGSYTSMAEVTTWLNTISPVEINLILADVALFPIKVLPELFGIKIFASIPSVLL